MPYNYSPSARRKAAQPSHFFPLGLGPGVGGLLRFHVSNYGLMCWKKKRKKTSAAKGFPEGRKAPMYTALQRRWVAKPRRRKPAEPLGCRRDAPQGGEPTIRRPNKAATDPPTSRQTGHTSAYNPSGQPFPYFFHGLISP